MSGPVRPTTHEPVKERTDCERHFTLTPQSRYCRRHRSWPTPRAHQRRPVVIDFIVGEDAQVWPMIAAGASNDEIQYVKSLAPLFEPDNIAEVAEEGEQ
jgi:hypothetical protein